MNMLPVQAVYIEMISALCKHHKGINRKLRHYQVHQMNERMKKRKERLIRLYYSWSSFK